jgi:hypothetical protein
MTNSAASGPLFFLSDVSSLIGYMPVEAARQQIDDMAARMKDMSSTHLAKLQDVCKSYEEIQRARNQAYENAVEALKQKALERLHYEQKKYHELEGKLAEVWLV